MSDLSVDYAWVQLMKDRPSEVPPEMIESISRVYREQTGKEITTAALMTTVEGIGWVSQMASERGLDLLELLGICEHVGDNARKNVERAKLGGLGEDELSIGVGAGFFTGVWLGLKHSDRRGG